MTFSLPSPSSDLKVSSMNSNGPPGRQKSFTSSQQHGWPRGFGALNSSPNSWIFTSPSVGSAPPSFIYGVHTAPKYGTKPIWYVTLHFRDRRSTALVRPRNRDEINICFLCLNKSSIGFYGHDFRCRSKAIQHSANILKLAWPNVVARHTHVVNTVDIFKIFVTFIPSHRDIARSGLSARNVRMERNEERLLSLSPFVDVWLATEVKEICKIVTVIININSWRPLVSSLGWA